MVLGGYLCAINACVAPPWQCLSPSCRSGCLVCFVFFFFSSRRRHTRSDRDWSSDVCSSDLERSASGCRPFSSGCARCRRWRRPPASERSWSSRVFSAPSPAGGWGATSSGSRSEERRVGEECRSRGSPYHLKKKKRENNVKV